MNKYESLVGYTNRKLIQYQEKTGVPIRSLFPGEKVVDSAWQKMLLALERSMHQCANRKKDLWGSPGTLLSGFGSVAHEECLWLRVGTSFQLSSFIRGDGYPCGGRWWAHWSVALLNHGYLSRTLSHCWPIRVAGCDEQHLDALQVGG